MKYSSIEYTRAFTALAEKDLSNSEENTLTRNFWAHIEKNGDMSHSGEIIRLTEKMLRQKYGKRHVLLETARPLSEVRKKLSKFLKSTDIVEEQVSPELIAGLRITVDGERQFDGSLAHKLKVLFSQTFMKV